MKNLETSVDCGIDFYDWALPLSFTWNCGTCGREEWEELPPYVFFTKTRHWYFWCTFSFLCFYLRLELGRDYNDCK